MVNNNSKNEIKVALKMYCDRLGSQNAAANSLDNVSSATISQILKGNWELISDEMWMSVQAQVMKRKKGWVIAETSVYKKIYAHLNDMKLNPKGIRGIIINASMGKSISVESFSENNPNTYYIRCHRQMSIRLLFRTMLKTMGKDNSGTTMEMLDNIIHYLERDNQPLFIIDEVDKLKDEVLEIFIDLENELHGKCGFAWLGTPYLQRRIYSGVGRNKRGFAELYSRLRKTFWDFTPTRKEFAKDVAIISKANGVDDENVILEMANKCEGDFRVLGDLIETYKKL